MTDSQPETPATLTPAVDPVCGSSVTADTPSARQFPHNAVTYHFCSETCRRRFKRDPERFTPTRPVPADGELSVETDAVVELVPTRGGYLCPVCPEVETDRPGRCPRCGVALEEAVAALDDRPDAELRVMTRRLVAGVVLGIPIGVLSLTDLIVPGRPVATALGEPAVLLTQAALALPVVFWCGWPLLARGWQSIRRRTPNMFTLVTIGILAATAYSVAGVAYRLLGVSPRANVPVIAAGVVSGPMAAAAQADQQQMDVGIQAGLAAMDSGHDLVLPFFDTAAGIIVLVLAGQVMELRARRRTSAAVQQLLDLTPPTARVVRADGGTDELPLDLVEVGDRVRVKPGERVPVDGVIREGTTAVDESPLTGEAQRVEKTVGMAVMAGSDNGLGAIEVEVTRGPNETLLAHVIHLVGRAQRSRAPLQRTVDRIARWFIPLVLLAALLTLVGWLTVGWIQTGGDWEKLASENWITYALVCGIGVLIISCPSAVGLAAPTAVVSGVARASRGGVLFRDASAIEKITRVSAVLFDKTGTLTAGKPRLTGVEPGIGEDPDRVLTLAAAVERGSVHPLGLAVVWEAVNRKLDIPVASDVRSVPGMGVVGTVGTDTVVVGNKQFLQDHGVQRDLVPAELARHRLYGRGVLMVGVNEHCIGLIVVQDPIRPTSKEAVTLIKRAGLKAILVSGDHTDTARAVAREVGIEEVIAETLPAEKYAVVRRLQNQGHRVAMIGEGVNDAPGLAAADVGIALGTGTDVAMNSAGVTLVTPDLRGVAVVRELGLATVRTIRQNLWLAFVFNVLAVPIAVGLLVPFGGGLLSPIWAAAAMSLSTISVIINSWRLGRRR